MASLKDRRLAWVGIACLLCVAALAYAPGLGGGFLFDDFVNLDALGATGPVDDWPTFWRYVTSGTADPTGRPVAMLSFLLDARDWPAPAGPFLRTNIAIHLANGLLLFLLLRRLGRILGKAGEDADAAALVAGGLWLLHPLLVSTTLYVVQRQSMLSAMFIFCGLLGYARLRELYARTGGLGILAAAGLALAAATALALGSKANGVLLPLLALVLEATVLRQLPRPDPRILGAFRVVVLGIPTAAVLCYLASFLADAGLALPERGWSVAQRLLSEPRALLGYLQLWFVPRSMSSGLYNDAFAASTSLLAPVSTLPSLAAVVALAVALPWMRRAHPAASAAFAFFLAGHLLESTTVPLELYFEHRNYLPAALLFWPLALALVGWRAKPGLRAAVALALIALMASTTRSRALLWSQPQQLARAWAWQSPASSRAQATVAMMDTSAGRPAEAYARLEPIWRAKPLDLQVAFNLINAECAMGELRPGDAGRLEKTLAGATQGTHLMNRWLGEAIQTAAGGGCRGLDLATINRWLAAMEQNPAFSSQLENDQEIAPLRARLALRMGDAPRARQLFGRALRAHPTPDAAARQAAELASSGAYREALAHLDEYESLKSEVLEPGPGMPRIHAWVLAKQRYWPREMAILRRKLSDELRESGSDG